MASKCSEHEGIRTIVTEENCPPLGLRFGLELGLVLRLGANFPRGQIVLEPNIKYHFRYHMLIL